MVFGFAWNLNPSGRFSPWSLPLTGILWSHLLLLLFHRHRFSFRFFFRLTSNIFFYWLSNFSPFVFSLMISLFQFLFRRHFFIFRPNFSSPFIRVFSKEFFLLWCWIYDFSFLSFLPSLFFFFSLLLSSFSFIFFLLSTNESL